MENSKNFDVIIVGGSYAGLSAAMSLGRALRKVLIIDSGQPCNQQTPHSHNFITHDGETPAHISALAKEQVAFYNTVTFYKGLAVSAGKTEQGFNLTSQNGDTFTAKKLVFATGLKDIMPNLPGFAECWGISILHCPYCHGYEVRNVKTGLLGNGDMGFELAKLISNWTKEIILFTNGESTLTAEQTTKLEEHNISIIQTEIKEFQHDQGKIRNVILKDQTEILVNAIYARPVFVQHCTIPEDLGCEITEQGFLKVDGFQRTTVAGVYACGDNSTFGRAVSLAVASGTATGAFVNKDLIEEEF
ncbi:NAD(P)/FAD-dependent oxidoreductase [Adhaeribacter radiodurans]|uniref:NAD(P)/FAD-dependent oxidoreductase n=1 Tax=Adhaeribacter radiodurans TaxID=2745197 RepID=A0A7L7LFP9_9BACT|nr:NAD(P)/FAD-dependent oxidoreductase [Adhaeribacter radiodurans]QMU31219.1 NAD(P)/FAD-dependent oxidoreductase [Adhaeribacter radiodurans]